jgi:hypothetical protein
MSSAIVLIIRFFTIITKTKYQYVCIIWLLLTQCGDGVLLDAILINFLPSYNHTTYPAAFLNDPMMLLCGRED